LPEREKVDIMTKMWKVMQTLIEYYGFSREDSDFLGDGKWADIYIFESDVNMVVIRIEYDNNGLDVIDAWCDVTNMDTEETLLSENLDNYDIENLSDYLDNIDKEYNIA
jgi:hypothetical protein